MIGTPLIIDMATVDLFRPSLAKVCVQIDLLKRFAFTNWFECGDSILGFWQNIGYERLSKYCKHCMRLGHDVHSCKIDYPPPKSALVPSKIYKQKEQFATDGANPNPQKSSNSPLQTQ